jgi:hypothetical protein
VLNAPDGWQAVDESRYVSHLALGELLVGLANGDVPDVTADRIPAERIGSNVPDSASDAERAEWDRMLRVVYGGQTKYQWDSQGDRRRYDLDPDRPNWQEETAGEVPVSDLESAFFDGPLDEYKQRAREGAAGVDVDEATAERLEDLGYL